MANDNFVQIIGHVTRDVELRYTPQGYAVASFGVAWTPRKKTASGGWEDGETSFFNCTAWRELGENVAASITKGMRVVVTGSIAARNWEDNDGNKRISVDIQVDECSPSLRWAQAQVAKTERDKPTNENRQAGGSGGGTSGQGYDYADSDEPF